jgi:magnesium chelatase family protein
MQTLSYVSHGFDGSVVTVEVDLRRGIPGMDIVGLPDGAVRESRERVRVAIRNSNYQFPRERILVNLAPAGVRKAGAAHDLPIAVAVLLESGQLTAVESAPAMVLGELELSGRVRGVPGVLSAVAAGLDAGARRFLVPRSNRQEAAVLAGDGAFGVASLDEACRLIAGALDKSTLGAPDPPSFPGLPEPDLIDIRGQLRAKRALEIAAAGMHSLFLYGPPGSGKTLAATRLPSILPDLSRREAIAVTRIHSLAGVLPPEVGLICRPPFRSPHHTASHEGMIGGGRVIRPGEVSLAHRGVLFLDEAPEFRKDLLQGLREPIEEKRVSVARADGHAWFPSDFQLVLASNLCPCGNLGREAQVCLCSQNEINAYWKRLGGALLDRVDIRLPMVPAPPAELLEGHRESSSSVLERVVRARSIQARRFENESFDRNARIPAGLVAAYCRLNDGASEELLSVSKSLGLSSRGSHSVLRIARTIADLAGARELRREHVLEAVQHRRGGETAGHQSAAGAWMSL